MRSFGTRPARTANELDAYTPGAFQREETLLKLGGVYVSTQRLIVNDVTYPIAGLTGTRVQRGRLTRALAIESLVIVILGSLGAIFGRKIGSPSKENFVFFLCLLPVGWLLCLSLSRPYRVLTLGSHGEHCVFSTDERRDAERVAEAIDRAIARHTRV